ncbi:hypothetical protein, partial [Vibrio cholerae]|uniref:hypothetical protein n=1 Tax=Vibrio cholerae TaxID=666 RepID=UPI001C8EB960
CSGVIGRFTKYSTSIFHFPLKPKLQLAYNAALRCDARLAILERSENAKRKESLLNALLYSVTNYAQYFL